MGLLWKIFLVCCGFVFFTSCESSFLKNREKTHLEQWMEQTKIRVLATTPIVQDLVARVGGDRIAIISLIPDEADPHSYEMVKGDGEKFICADIVFANGLMLEHSASVQYQLRQHKHVVFLGDEIFRQCPHQIIYVDGQIDPHIWMDVSLWAQGIDCIVQALIRRDPDHEKFYLAQSDQIREEFQELDHQIGDICSKVPLENRFIITSHDAFRYFVKRYLSVPSEREGESWQNRLKALQGLAPDQQISLLQVNEIVNYVCCNAIKIIFAEKNLSRDSLEKVKESCKKKGQIVRIAEEHLYGDTMGREGYASMILHNAQVICKFLLNKDFEERNA